MISEEELKKLRKAIGMQKEFDEELDKLPNCPSCRYYAFRVRRNGNGVDMLHYCRLSGKPVSVSDICDSYNARTYLWNKENEKRNEFLEKYISPLEYIGLVSRVLESSYPNHIVLYAEQKIHGKDVKVQIDMDNYETHKVTFLMDDPKPRKAGDRIWMQTTMPSYAKCGESYSRLLADFIKNALNEFTDFCKRNE